MRSIVVTAAVGFSSLWSVAVHAQAPEASKAVRGRVEAFQGAWNAHDARAVAAIFSEDADQVMGDGPLTVGRPALERWWQERFANMEPTRRIALTVNSIRFLNTQVAVINATAEMAVSPAQGQQAASSRDRGTWILIQKDGTWQVAALRVLAAEAAVRR